MNPTQLDLDSALQRFGLTSFRPGQREVISAIVAGNDCMCVMPTGGGKSLCFQLPSVIRPGLTIVVSPLIALMKDQVDALGQKGIPAALINSTLSLGEQTARLQDVAAGKFQLVYVAPERLRSPRFMEAIRATPIQLLAIDEAHCISQWGHDFRPDYARLGQFRQWLGDVQTVALTATATPRVRQDIVDVLRLSNPKQFMSGFARPNLDFGVVQRQSEREKDEQLEQFLKREPGSGIIYAATRKRCDSLVEMIQQKLKISVGAYHAGMQLEQRRAIQERFMRDDLRIIVATNAFGMGIDKPDLRFVIHYNIPGSLEAYYQEAGRAGRDSQQSQCVLLYSYQDRYIQEFFIDNNYPAREVIEKVYDFLVDRPEDPIELTHEEIRDALGLSVSSEAIGSSLQTIARTGVLERLETGGGLAMLRIESELPTLVDMLPKDATAKRKTLRVVERIVGQRRGEAVFVHPRWLTQELGMEREAMNRNLRELVKLKIIDFVPPFRGRAVHFLKQGVPFSELEIDFSALTKRKEAEYERLNQVVRYAQTPRCRQAAILDYFGDLAAADCGHCDRCLGAQGWPNLAQKMRDGHSQCDTPAQLAQDERGGQSVANERTIASEQAVEPNNSSVARSVVGRPKLVEWLSEVHAAIDRTHGRLGKILIAQFLCGSNNAKVQKLRLHRLSGFGLLEGCRQTDAVELIDAFLSVGLLEQNEVNRNRPTVSVPQDLKRGVVARSALLARVCIHERLASRLESLATLKTKGPDTKDSVLASESKTVSATESVRASEPAPLPPVEPEEWSWTWQLFIDGYTWTHVMAIRRKADLEIAGDLQIALKNGKNVQRAWLAAGQESSAGPTAGQQRLLRELQRRSAAGVG